MQVHEVMTEPPQHPGPLGPSRQPDRRLSPGRVPRHYLTPERPARPDSRPATRRGALNPWRVALLRRVSGEYYEMPCLRLTRGQAQRLFGLRSLARS